VVPVEEWSALFDHSPIALACVSPTLRLVRANGLFASLCQTMVGQVVGRYCYEVLGEPRADGEHKPTPCSSCLALTCLRTGRVQRFERALAPAVLNIVAAPMRDSRGLVRGAVLMIADVTAEVELRRQLAHAQKLAAIGQMTSGVAHELKNPLASVIGYAQLLRRCSGLSEEAQTHIGRIVAEAKRCDHIVRNLLRFTRQKGRGKVVTDLNSVVRESLELLRYQLSTSGIEIQEDYAATVLPTMADPYELRQVAHNLIQNAFDAMRGAGAGGHLTVRTRQEDSRVVMEFEDNGPGLEDIDRVFEPFYTTKEAGEGTGLGLAISRSIVEKHGGGISAKSNIPRGAVFRVDFPRAITSAAAPVGAQASSL